MAQAEQLRTLTRFTIEEAGDDYAIHIEDDAGETIDLKASPEQIDVLADALDELLYYDDADELDEDADRETGGHA